ncbi:RNA-directed DNA polymerase, eukaryota, nucleotide-binding alpha-beta plait domain protein [Tanacetum coccineum]
MGFRFQNSLQSKIDQTSKISKSVFISNFPDDCSSRDLWKVCNGYGTVVDVFIPNKRSKAGKRFAFVRFINVLNLDRLIENLKTIWIGRFYLSANILFVLKGLNLLPFRKRNRAPSGNLKNIVWVDIEGVPLNAWTRSTFQKISSKWGELVELEDGSAKINEQANNLNNDEVENASEVVSDTYFGDNSEVQGFEHQHGESNDKEIFLRAESVRPPSSRGHRIMSRVIEEAKTP